MKQKELQDLIKVSYHQVGLYGRDAARIYHAMVALDTEVLMLRNMIRLMSPVSEELPDIELP